MSLRQPVCPECGSANVRMDASVEWSVALQQWVLCDNLDFKECGDCGDELDVFKEVEAEVSVFSKEVITLDQFLAMKVQLPNGDIVDSYVLNNEANNTSSLYIDHREKSGDDSLGALCIDFRTQ